jgi:hypothetical protein
VSVHVYSYSSRRSTFIDSWVIAATFVTSESIEFNWQAVSTDLDSFIPQVDVHRLVGYYCNVCNPRVDIIRLVVSTDLDSIIPQVDVHRLVGSCCNLCNPRVDVIRLAVSTDVDSVIPQVDVHRLVVITATYVTRESMLFDWRSPWIC